MRELTFFTTSATKLAHARYLAEGHPIRIQGFRQRTYHAAYIEPRDKSRDNILEASYRSALSQLTKAGYSAASHPFILEDTSVRIEALSKPGDEIPGVDIKYWMREQTFHSLNELLISAGNIRDAVVRSDVLLHVPRGLRSAWGTDRDFIIFTGEQHGSIITHAEPFKTNLVYPWLDNLSFNKWFQAEGSNGPLGSLPIEIADKVDFRRKAFDKLFSFLQQRRFFGAQEKQFSFPLEQKPNFILCGYPCAGKTTASQHLVRSFDYLHVEASDFMHLSYYYRHGYRGPTPIGDFAESALRQKPTIAAEKVAEYLAENLAEPAVVSGFRAPEEIAFLVKEMATFGKQFEILFIDADDQVRFERLRQRARPGDDLTAEAFDIRDLQQKRMGLDDIRTGDKVDHISNNGLLNDFLEELDSKVGNEAAHDIDIVSGLDSIASIIEIGLQDAILVALLSVWLSDEARKFYSTTEIAALVGRALPAISPKKHKDNVSRYFNQDFYAFFEISGTGTGSKRKYRLSNTGYGTALRALRSILHSRKRTTNTLA